jgi:hypothetical protein
MTLLSSADERGLHGLSLDTLVRQAFFAMPPAVLAQLDQRMTAGAFARNLIYLRDGQTEAIRILMRPTGIMPDQLAYLHYASLTLINALKRLPDLYIQDFAVRGVVPLTAPEEKWLWDCWGPSQREANPVFGRLDAVIDFTSPMWKDSLHYMEPNLSGVGGIHIIPATEQLLAEVVMPVVREYAPRLMLEPGQDLREMFLQEIADHLDAIGRAGRTLCFIEPKYSTDGPAEQAALTEYYRERHGLKVLHADPSELHLQDGEVCYEGEVVDIGYRDYEVRDYLDGGDEGLTSGRSNAVQAEPDVVAGGEFDHKSAGNLTVTSSRGYFNATTPVAAAMCWTRVLADRAPRCRTADNNFLEFAVTNRRR